MAQEITLSLKESNVDFIREHASKTHTSVSEIIDDYLELLQKIELASQQEKTHPYVQAFAGLVQTGRNETTETIFE